MTNILIGEKFNTFCSWDTLSPPIPLERIDIPDVASESLSLTCENMYFAWGSNENQKNKK